MIKFKQTKWFCYVLLFLFLQSCNSYKNSPEVICLKNISHEIKSIDISSDNSDFSFLKKILSDDSVKIVLLGEQTHYDGTTFTAKAKLIKYLHEACGFDILAFESGLYDCYKGWEMIQQDKKYANGLSGSIFGLWLSTKEFSPLVDYLQSTIETQNPLIFAGFDCALTRYTSQMFLLEDLDRLKLLDKDSQEHEQFALLLKHLAYSNQNDENFKPNSSDLDNNVKLIDRILNKLDTLHNEMISETKREFWLHVISGLKVAYGSLYYFKNSIMSEEGNPISNKRDIKMADNLIWLSQKMYPNKKIIVWAANFHIMRNFKGIEFSNPPENISNKTVTMGDVIYKNFGKKTYSITFTDYENYLNGKSTDSTIESSLKNTGYEYSFTPLRGLNRAECISNKFTGKMLGHIELKGKWNDISDAIFFIKEINKSNFEK